MKDPSSSEKAVPVERSFFNADFPLIRKASLVLLATLASSIALVYASSVVKARQQERLRQAQARLDDMRRKFDQAQNEKLGIQEFQLKFNQLRERGIIGEEKRLDWIETIQRIREARKLAPITYEISAQRSFAVDPSIPVGDFELRGSTMKMRLELWHEMDLLHFLEDIKSQGLNTVQACDISRMSKTVKADAPSPRLTAECTINWLTLGPRSANLAPPPTAVAQ